MHVVKAQLRFFNDKELSCEEAGPLQNAVGARERLLPFAGK